MAKTATRNRSQEAVEKARKLIPGLTQVLSKRPDQFSLGIWPAYFKRASGVEIWDLDGNRYVDMSLSGLGANVLGYCDPDVDAAVLEAVKNGNSSSLSCPEELALAELLIDIHPWAEKVRYARGGGEAMAMAVRIARAHTRRSIVAFCGYHGWHDWYLAANIAEEGALDRHLLTGLSPIGVPKELKGTSMPFAYNDLAELKKIASRHKNDLAAVVIEPIRGEAPTREYIEGVESIARETGAVFIVDEVSSGFRINTGGAHLKLGIKPDVAVFSKALGNGYPIAAVIGKADVLRAAEDTFISSTYWTERVGFAAAIAMIGKFRDKDVSRHLVRIGQAVQDGWRAAAKKRGLGLVDVGGIPPLGHFSFEGNHGELKALFIQLMLEKGFLASSLFYSMYAHADAHVSAYLKAVDESFAEIARLKASGKVRSALKGAPSNPGFKRLVH